MPVSINTRTDTRELSSYARAIGATPQIIQDVVQHDVLPSDIRYVNESLAPYPPPIQPGVFKQYATPAQKRAVMAKIRRGEWTGRTGALAEAWRTAYEALSNGASTAIYNASRVARFIIGVNQQRFLEHWLRVHERASAVHQRRHRVFTAGFRKRFKEQVRKHG